MDESDEKISLKSERSSRKALAQKTSLVNAWENGTTVDYSICFAVPFKTLHPEKPHDALMK